MTVTCLMPRAAETDFFERADMMDIKVRFTAMMNGDGASAFSMIGRFEPFRASTVAECRRDGQRLDVPSNVDRPACFSVADLRWSPRTNQA